MVVKAQALSGGRGKAGGVKFARSGEEAQQAAHEILSMSVGGFAVKRVLVAEALQIKEEYYVALVIDRGARCVACIMSAAGGVDIEEVARTTPQKILSIPLPSFPQIHQIQGSIATRAVFGSPEMAESAATVIASMSRLFNEKDCSLVEINPLVMTKDNTLIAADAKIVLDDNALYKHPDMAALRNGEEYSDDERAAQQAGLSFVGLDGSIGCMVNGAGLAMATMDMIQIFKSRPANFLDVGGSSNPQKVVNAFRILLANQNIKVILVNIFGGITRCDDIARGIILAKQQLAIALPMVVRLIGTNEDQGRRLLAGAGIVAMSDMTEAVKHAVALEGRQA